MDVLKIVLKIIGTKEVFVAKRKHPNKLTKKWVNKDIKKCQK